MSDNLISFSKDAAKTLGISEAILLHALTNTLKPSKEDFISFEDVLERLNFWEEKKIKTLLKKLQLKGLITFDEGVKEIYLMNLKKEKLATKVQPYFEERSESFIEKNWKPEETLIEQSGEYGIPRNFVLSQVKDFLLLHKEKNDSSHSWGIKFLRFVIKQWRKQEISDFKESRRKPIDQSWKPDDDAMEILSNSGIDKEFIKNEIPEFILYWSDKGEISDSWNTKFISQVRRQWAKNQHLIENTESPYPIKENWRPSEDFYQVLELTGISKKFADSQIYEFILYWKETGQSHNSWNSKFIQHVKYQWQRQEKFGPKETIKEVEKRIESSWEIKPSEDTSSTKPRSSKKKIHSRLQELKEKHRL